MVIQSFTEKTWDRDRYPNISWNESSCSKTQGCVVDVDFLDLIQEMRSELNFSMAFTSIYRDATHPVEDKKVAAGKRPGSHNMGCAVDIKVRGEQAAWAWVSGGNPDCGRISHARGNPTLHRQRPGYVLPPTEERELNNGKNSIAGRNA